MRYIAFLAALLAALALAPPAAAATDWAWPVRGDVVTPYKNGDDPYAAGQHRGIDIAAPVGTRVSAATGGRVTFAGVAGGSGSTVNVRTADGSYDVAYLHLSAVATHEGDTVGRGDPIGAVGISGTRSVEQPHLHLGVREAGDRHAYRDPLNFLPTLAPPATEQPPPTPAEATDPLLAPPAAAPALSRAPAELTTEALGPLPSTVSLGVLGADGDAASSALAPAAPIEASDAPAGGSAAAGHGAAGTHAAPGSATSGAEASPSRADTAPAHGSASPLHDAAPRSPGVTRQHPAAPRGRPITRADLGSPTRSPEQARPTIPATRLHLAAPDRAAPAKPSGQAGLDVGWLAAVLGLVTLATCLGRPQQARRTVRTSRTALGAILRPLAGRG